MNSPSTSLLQQEATKASLQQTNLFQKTNSSTASPSLNARTNSICSTPRSFPSSSEGSPHSSLVELQGQPTTTTSSSSHLERRESDIFKFKKTEAVKIVYVTIRRHVLSNRLKNFCKKHSSLKIQRQRFSVMNEILESERQYVESLKILLEVFYTPLKQEKILQDDQFKSIFGNIEGIYSMNSQILIELEKQMEDALQRRIQTAFMKFVPFLRLYSTYISNFDTGMELFESLNHPTKGNQKFKAFLLQCKSHPLIKQANRITMDAIAIKPIQRVAQYNLLFNELLKATPKNHVDFESCTKCVESLKDIANQLNYAKRLKESVSTLNNLPKLVPQKYKPLLLDLDLRKFIRTSDIKCLKIQSNLQTKDVKSVEEIKAFLYTDCVIFFDETNSKECYFIPLPFAVLLKEKSLLTSFGSESLTLVLDCIENGTEQRFGIIFDNKEECNIWYLQLTKLEVPELKTPILPNKVLGNAVTIQSGEPGYQLAIRRKKINSQFRVTAEKQAALDLSEKEIESNELLLQTRLQELEKQLKEIQQQISKAKTELKTVQDSKNEITKQKTGVRKDLTNYLNQLDVLDSKLLKEYLHEDAQLFEVALGTDPVEKEVASQLRSPYSDQIIISPRKIQENSSETATQRGRSKTTVCAEVNSSATISEQSVTEVEEGTKEKKRSRFATIFMKKKDKE